MDPARWRHIRDVFSEAVELPADACPRYLEQVCGNDMELRAEVESMLAMDRADDQTLDSLIGGAAAGLTAERDRIESASNIGRRIGPYRIVRQVGEGGMGAVYQAVRADDQYRQSVAIKLIAHGADSPDSQARFRTERQILATLQHPNIAALLDGGTTEQGQPYIVMEYIEGEPLLDYARRKQLSIAERLQLFCDVCGAVQHAHQMLVIHRDIKPMNVLVTETGVAKLLDFGIAKLLAPELVADGESPTQTAIRRMTPQYASPEQVRGEQLTTATDIYSLGVLLYELLTFNSPYSITGRTPHEVEQAICESDPIRLSAAAKDDPKLRRQLSGDLENVVAMAMRKEPQRRYASVQQFADDVGRYLKGLPVSARDDTLFYVTSKLVRRNKLASAAFALLLLSVAAGWTTTMYEAKRAERRFEEVRKLANSMLFDLHGEIRKLPGSTPVREQLVRTSLNYLNNLSRDAGRDISFQWELSQAYELIGDAQGDPSGANLGQFRPALASYTKALDLVQPIAAQQPTYKVLSCMTWLHYKCADLEARTVSLEKGVAGYMRGLAVARRVADELQDRRADDLLRNGYQRLAMAQVSLGKLSLALENARLAASAADRDAQRKTGIGPKVNSAGNRVLLGNVLWLMGDLHGAWDAYSHAVRLLEEAGVERGNNVSHIEELQEAYRRAGDLLGNPAYFHFGEPARAESYHRKALALGERLAARDVQDARAKTQLYVELRRLAAVMRETKPAESAVLYKRSLDGASALWKEAPDDINYARDVANTRLGYSFALRGLGNLSAAAKELDATLSIQQQLRAKHPERAVIREDMFDTFLAMGELALISGDADRARLNLERSLQHARALVTEGRMDLYSERCLALALRRMGDFHAWQARRAPRQSAAENKAKAAGYYDEALAIWTGWKSRNLGLPYSVRQESQLLRAKAGLSEGRAPLLPGAAQ